MHKGLGADISVAVLGQFTAVINGLTFVNKWHNFAANKLA